MMTRSIPPVPAGRPRLAGFTLIEMLVVIAIITVLAALLFTAVGSMRESSRSAQNLARMKTVGTALLTGAAENRGFIPSVANRRGRWPAAAHQYLGIRPDVSPYSGQMPNLFAAQPDLANLVTSNARTAEILRPVQFDHIRKASIASGITEYEGVWLINNNLVWIGTNPNDATKKPMPLLSIVAPSKTPLLGMPSTNNGIGIGERRNVRVHSSARAQGFTGPTDDKGPAPVAKGKMFYVMCDGSAQTLPDFWPFQDPEWPEPWKAFHPLGKNAPASDAP